MTSALIQLAALFLFLLAPSIPSPKASTISFVYIQQQKNGLLLQVKGSDLAFTLEQEAKSAQLTFPKTSLLFPYNQILVGIPPIQQVDIRERDGSTSLLVSLTESSRPQVLGTSSKTEVDILFPKSSAEAPPPPPKKPEKEPLQIELLPKEKELTLSLTSPQVIPFETKKLAFPDRFLIALKGVVIPEPANYPVDSPPVTKITALPLPSLSMTQVMIHFTKLKEPKVSVENEGKKVLFTIPLEAAAKPTPPKELVKKAPPPPSPPPEVKVTKTPPPAQPIVVPLPPLPTPAPPTAQPAPTPLPTVTSAAVQEIALKKEKSRALLSIVGDRVLAYKAKLIPSPPKILLELFQAKLAFPKKEIPIHLGIVQRARAYQYQTSPVAIARLVIDLSRATSYEITPAENGKKLLLRVHAPEEPQTIATYPKLKKTPKTSSPPIPLPPPVYATGGKERLVNMEFKDASVEDMIRVLAEMAGLNVFIVEQDATTLNTITGRGVTMRLVDMPVQRALDMVITTSNLAYRVVGNTLIIASDFDTVNRVGSTILLGDFRVETFAIPGYTRTEFISILKQAVPEAIPIETSPNRPPDQITIIGPPYTLKRVENLIASLKPQPEVFAETFDLNSLDPDDVEQALQTAVPEAKVISKKTSPNLITVSGSKFTLERTKTFLGTLNLQPVITYRTVQVSETEPKELQTLIHKVLPGVDLVRAVKGFSSTSVTLSGTSQDLDQAEKLIQNIEGGSDKKDMAKSVAVIPLKYVDTVKDLEVSSDFDLVKLIKDAVPGIDASGGSIILDTRNNSVIVKATPSDIERAKKFVSELDLKQPQVLIETQVLEISQDDLKKFTSSFSEIAETPQEDIKSTHPPGVSTSLAGNTAGQVNIFFNALRGKFDLGLNALVTSGKARSLASPKVATLSGRKAKISLTNTFVFPIETQSTVPGTNVTTTTRVFQTQDIGITLEITPRVNEDGTVTLNLHPTVELPTQRDPGQPVETNKREVETLMRIPDGGAVVIGGLVSSEESDSLKKIPFLGDIPIIGKLFQSRDKRITDREVAIIVTARVLKK